MKKIQIPEFIKEIKQDDLVKFAKAVSDGNINIYTLIRDENSKIVGERQVFLKSQIIDELEYINEQIIRKEEMLQKLKNKSKKELERELLHLRKSYKEFLESPTYEPLLESEEITEYNEMVELNIAETFGSIKSYTMKKTD